MVDTALMTCHLPIQDHNLLELVTHGAERIPEHQPKAAREFICSLLPIGRPPECRLAKRMVSL